eukprot:365771-Chlamydomonas_euryale.AAC.9
MKQGAEVWANSSSRKRLASTCASGLHVHANNLCMRPKRTCSLHVHANYLCMQPTRACGLRVHANYLCMPHQMKNMHMGDGQSVSRARTPAWSRTFPADWSLAPPAVADGFGTGSPQMRALRQRR